MTSCAASRRRCFAAALDRPAPVAVHLRRAPSTSRTECRRPGPSASRPWSGAGGGPRSRWQPRSVHPSADGRARAALRRTARTGAPAQRHGQNGAARRSPRRRTPGNSGSIIRHLSSVRSLVQHRCASPCCRRVTGVHTGSFVERVATRSNHDPPGHPAHPVSYRRYLEPESESPLSPSVVGPAESGVVESSRNLQDVQGNHSIRLLSSGFSRCPTAQISAGGLPSTGRRHRRTAECGARPAVPLRRSRQRKA